MENRFTNEFSPTPHTTLKQHDSDGGRVQHIYQIFLDGPLARGEPVAGRFQEENQDFQSLDKKERNHLFFLNN